jgi:glycosyltransferase involved in cell wall biosynthesis
MHDLRRVAGSTIHFLGRVGDKEKVPLIAWAKGFLNLAYESFGIVTIEALLLGVPVFGNIQWGTGELVWKNMGLTTDVRDDRVLEQAFVKFIHTDHDRTYIQSTARNTFLPQQQWWEEKI